MFEKYGKVRKVIQYGQYAQDSDSVFGEETHGKVRKSKEKLGK